MMVPHISRAAAMLRGKIGVATAIALLMLIGAGCGSSSKTSSSTHPTASATTAAASAPKAGGKVIKIMAQSAVGTPSFSTPGVWAAAISAAKAANAVSAAGKGRQIEIITCNDQQTASGASQCAQQAIADHVVTVVGYTGFTYLEAPILAKAGIPMQNLALAASDLKNPNVYPVNGAAYAPEFAAMGNIAKRVNAKRVAIAVVNFPGIAPGVAVEKKALALDGITPVTSDVPIQLTQTDFSSVVEKLRSANADAVLLNSSGPQVAPILQAARSVAYNPYWIIPVGADSYSIFKSAAGLSDKLYFSATTPDFLPPGNTAYSAINSMRAQMQRYGGGDGALSDQDESTIFCWLTVHTAIDLISRIKGSVTPSTYVAELKKSKDVNVDGLWSWTPSARFPAIADPRTFVGHAVNGYATYDARTPTLAAFR